VKVIKEAMTNYKAQNPKWERIDLAFRHLGFVCHLDFGIWILV
jgi:hypothetical protein